jgi:hypothetical protein
VPAQHRSTQQKKLTFQSMFSLHSYADQEPEGLDEICSELDTAVKAFAAQYKRAMQRCATSDEEARERAATSIKQALGTLRAVQRLRPASTWGGDGPQAPSVAEQQWLSLQTGNRRRFKDLPSVVRRVQQHRRFVGHWAAQVQPRSGSGGSIPGSLPSQPRSGPRVALQIDDWEGVDVFRLDAESQQRPLTEVFMTIWEAQRFDTMCKSTGDQVFSLMRAIEDKYLDNPYHNRMHAADVTLIAYYFWSRLASQDYMRSYFAEVDLLVLIIAAAIHDMAHPGVNNDFLVRTRDSLALRYNDRSALENMHVSTAFQLMARQGTSLLEQKQSGGAPQSALRARIVDMVLATDMSQHKKTHEALGEEYTQHRDNLQDIDKLVLEKNMLHMADLGHSLRPWCLHKEWSHRLSEEFFAQGDQEKALGFPFSSTLFDREKSVFFAKGQVGFLSFVIKPCWKNVHNMMGPAGKDLEECLKSNIARWEQEVAEEEDREAVRREKEEKEERVVVNL